MSIHTVGPDKRRKVSTITVEVNVPNATVRTRAGYSMRVRDAPPGHSAEYREMGRVAARIANREVISHESTFDVEPTLDGWNVGWRSQVLRFGRAVAKRERTIPGRFAEQFPIGFVDGSAKRIPSRSQSGSSSSAPAGTMTGSQSSVTSGSSNVV